MKTESNTMEPILLVLTRPMTRVSVWMREGTILLIGSVFISVLAQLTFYLPHTPVPVTGQTLGVLLVGASMGASRGLMSTCLYLLLGCVGLPVFAEGAFGIEKFFGATGGYLVGFVAASYLVGKLMELGNDRRWVTALPVFLLGHATIFFFGLIGLGFYTGAWENVLQWGLIPFIPGLVVKTVIAGIILPSSWRWVERTRGAK